MLRAGYLSPGPLVLRTAPAMPGQGQMRCDCQWGLIFRRLQLLQPCSLLPALSACRSSPPNRFSMLFRKTSEPAHLVRYRDVSLYMVRIEGTAEHAHPSSDPPRIALASPSLASAPSDCEPVRGADTCVRMSHVPSDRLNSAQAGATLSSIASPARRPRPAAPHTAASAPVLTHFPPALSK